MIIQDRVYGKLSVEEPVLVELMNTRPVQRLKKIEQYGVPAEWYRVPGFRRYEHSVGVMLLLRKLGASVEEQVAGLLHDVSHTAFSHVVDWVLGHSANEDYQDTVHEQFLRHPELLPVLGKYGFDVSKIGDLASFSLLEQPIPDICADRFDYTVRELACCGRVHDAQHHISNLAVSNGKMVFKSNEAAKAFGEQYLNCQVEHWGGYDAALRYFLMSNLLKRALDCGVISEGDFLTDDESVVQKLKVSTDAEIQGTISVLAHDLRFVVDDANPSVQIKKKFRYVDPLFIDNGVIKRVSSAYQDYENLIEMHRGRNAKGINVRFL